MSNNFLPAGWGVAPTCQGHEWVFPPFVDLSACLYGSGDVARECLAAHDNGFLHVVVPADCLQVLDTPSRLKELPVSDNINIYPVAAMTMGLQGERLTDMYALQQQGAIAVSHGWGNACNDDVLLRTLEYAQSFAIKVFFCSNTPALSKDGVAHDGYIASYHGLAPISPLSETVALAKQLLMVEYTGVHAHFAQLSCAKSVQMIKEAKDKGLCVTCDVAMHQLYLTDEAIIGFDSNAYVLPPLRTEADRQALRQGVKDGTIDAICSHHRPTANKHAPFADCPAGVSAFDSFVPLACQLVADGFLTKEALVEKISTSPAAIAGITKQWQDKGGAVVIDPSATFCLNADTMRSAGHNTPLFNHTLTGKVVAVH